MPLKELLGAVAVGAREKYFYTTLANRLTRLENQLTDKEKVSEQVLFFHSKDI